MDSLIACDFETVEIQPDGTTVASTEAYRPNFRVSSMATTEVVDGHFVSKYYEGEETCREVLRGLQGRPLLCFNLQFEALVSMYRFPDLKLNWAVDAQRLAQNYDNGGDPYAMEVIPYDVELDEPEDSPRTESVYGFGLVKCVKRILKLPDHKIEAHTWLTSNGICKAGQEGAHLNHLPRDIMERYNTGDTENTFRLYQHCVAKFAEICYDWTIDHKLYLGRARRLAEAKGRGIKVDRVKLAQSVKELSNDMDTLENAFKAAMAEPIKAVERNLLVKRLKKFKTLKGAKKYIAKHRVKANPEVRFKPGSTHQLADLFCNQLGIHPFFYTDKGAPSFKAAHLYSYGDGGKLLTERKRHQIVLTQCNALLNKSEFDQFWHVDLKSVGTCTNRLAGSGGLNIQALARRRQQLMACMIPTNADNVFVSQDASAGEPSILTEYTKDINYRYFCFDGVDKAPYYKDGVLMIGDVYLAYASVCPMFKDEVAKAFKETYVDGRSFAEQWLADPEVIKERLKKVRKNAKWIALAFGYGLGPKTFYKKSIEAGLQVTRRMCNDGFAAYWELFKGIKAYCNQLESHVESEGWLQNPFGYRFQPTEVRKSFNGMVQSSVSSLFDWYCDLMEIEAPYAKFVTIIHDEVIWECPKVLIEDFRQVQSKVTEHLNAELNWSLKLRFGFVVGSNLFEAK